MAFIGISLIVASVVLFCLRPPPWLPNLLAGLRQQRLDAPEPRPRVAPAEDDGTSAKQASTSARQNSRPEQPAPVIREAEEAAVARDETEASVGHGAKEEQVQIQVDDDQPTPKALPAARDDTVPALVLPDAHAPSKPVPVPVLGQPKTASELMPPPPIPKPLARPRPSSIPQPSSSSSSSTPPRRVPTLAPPSSGPAPNRERNLPIPRRSGLSTASSSSSSSLFPPPTATAVPKKPSRQVTLTPGHSPLDWARLANSPTSDLRGLPPHTPYLRVTPSMLKQQNGRKGRDAWTVYGGKVYNISPYVSFHPGGGPELLRGAGKDGTRLFAEVHPWVNYETMLSACLIGIFVDEHEAQGAMEEMD